MGNKTLKPVISVNLKRPLIRIHKETLHILGYPDYILLLVNPKECTLAILPSDSSDPKAYHISRKSIINRKSIELYSASLIQSLQNLCSNWKDNKAYRLYGEVVLGKAVIRFNMAKAISMNE